MINFQEELNTIGQQALKSFHQFIGFSTQKKNNCLREIANLIRQNSTIIEQENKKDLIIGEKKSLSKAMLDRLKLDKKRIEDIAQDVEKIVTLEDLVGSIDKKFTQKDNLQITKQRTPIGVIGIIYESRPNVTIDAACLCLKSGNAVILRGGKEAINTNQAFINILYQALKNTSLPAKLVQFIPWTNREAVKYLLKLDKYINLIIPRGGEQLMRTVVENSTIPIVKHDKGLCHIYVDKDVNLEMAKKIIVNAKCQRPGVCNACETLLVHKDILPQFISQISPTLKNKNIELRADKKYKKYDKEVKLATKKDWNTEYLDLILSIKVVDDIHEAITHINHYGSGHSDAIISNDKKTQEKFLMLVDSATVYANASTRFTDGSAFGFGAEIGISTNRLHCRGPMALRELTTYKYIVRGEGQIRQ